MAYKTIDELTDPTFVEGLTNLPLSEIRSRRSACQDAEEVLSLRRRLVQGRLDIVHADLDRRAGQVGSKHENVVDELSQILIDRGERQVGSGSAGVGRLSRLDVGETQLGEGFEQFIHDLDRVVDGNTLSSLKERDESSVRAIAEELNQRERALSQTRLKLHRHIDSLQEEVVRRYKTGEASVDGLLAGE